ncbi:MAG: aldo/keto reductase [Gemmatimonadaceae bacterium]
MTQQQLLDRVVLGTVQLGIPYGRTSQSGLMPETVAFELLDAAWELGLRCFDTAEAYGSSAARLAAWLDRSGHRASACLITKIGVASPVADIAPAAARALTRFEGARELTLLSHGPVTGDIWSRLRDAAAEADACAGQSVYEPQEVAAAWACVGTAVVQVPANVFDSRAMIPPPGDRGAMHYRSIFLQGILLDRPSVAEERVSGGGRLAEAVQSASAEAGVPAPSLLVAAVLRAAREADKVVIGADSAEELQAISLALSASADAVDQFMRRIAEQPTPQPAVLDPRRWVHKS